MGWEGEEGGAVEAGFVVRVEVWELWELDLSCLSRSGKLWERDLLVFYMSGKPWGSQISRSSTNLRNQVGPLKKNPHACGVGVGWGRSGDLSCNLLNVSRILALEVRF